MSKKVIDVINQELAELEKQLKDHRKVLDEYGELLTKQKSLRDALKLVDPIIRPSPVPGRNQAGLGFDSNAIINIISTHNGPISAALIRERLGIPPSRSNAFSQKMAELVRRGVVEKIGERRTTKYIVQSRHG